MKPFCRLLIIICLLATASGCSHDKTSILKKKVSGKIGELVVVIPEIQWKDTIGSTIKGLLAQEQVSLPQSEPLFDLLPVPPAAFADIFKANRSILQVHVNSTVDSTRVVYRYDVWAQPQSVVEIYAKDKTDFLQLFKEKGNKIAAFMLQGERNRLMGNYAKYPKREVIADIKKKFGIDIILPVGYVKASDKDNFYWARFDTPEITQSVMVYSFPYTSDSTFTSDYLVNKRDSLLHAYVEGPSDSSYMVSEHRVPTACQILKYKGNYAAEVRGLWRLEGDWMGGPYVLLAVLSPDHKRVVVLDGWVYAPQKDKRNYVRQLEAMIYSLNFPKAEK
ncbi:MAG: DUF4837 family protein [Mangrovibacterium sp.]